MTERIRSPSNFLLSSVSPNGLLTSLSNRSGDSTSSMRMNCFYSPVFVDFITNDWSLSVLWFFLLSFVFPVSFITHIWTTLTYSLRRRNFGENLSTFLMFNLLLVFYAMYIWRLCFCQRYHHHSLLLYALSTYDDENVYKMWD